MKETPLLFKPEMVRATLREINPKEQTRRLISKLLKFGMITEFGVSDTPGYDWHFRDKRMLWNDISHDMLLECCPYGKVGDRLWVKETWAARPDQDHLPPSQCDDTGLWWKASLNGTETGYAACHGKWRPSIFMPRWASRILLEITAIRVERLQDISDADAKAEGVSFGNITDQVTGEIDCDAVEAYRYLWEKINGAGSWDDNPWVWVVEFKRID